MSQQALAILLAGVFTFGCAAIHLWREHASALTPSLAAATLWLMILTGSVLLIRNGGDGGGRPSPVARTLR